MPYQSHTEDFVQELRGDPEWASLYLSVVLEDGDEVEVTDALACVGRALGGAHVEQEARRRAAQFYRTLSPVANPELRRVTEDLAALGMRLAIVHRPR